MQSKTPEDLSQTQILKNEKQRNIKMIKPVDISANCN